MAERQQRYTDFKDPFDLLTDLHSTRLRMIYQNEFAHGDRTDIAMGTRQYPNSGVGKVNTPNYNLSVGAPTSMFQAREGSGQVLPSPVSINYERDYGKQRLDRMETRRIGSILSPVTAAAVDFGKNISSINARRKAAQVEDTRRAYYNTFDPSRNYNLAYENAYTASQQAQQQTQQQAQHEQSVAPQISKLGELTNEMENVGAQIEQRKTLLGMTKGIEEFRNLQRQTQGQTEIERRRGIGQRIAESVAPQVTETLPKSGLTPYKMLNPNPYDPENIRTQLENLMSQKSPAPQGAGLTPMNVDFGKSNIPPGPSSPFPPINKVQNTSVLGGPPTTPPPSGYNPSQSTPPGPKSMHRRRPR